MSASAYKVSQRLMYLKQWSVIKRILSSEFSCTRLEVQSKTNWGWGEAGDESEDESTRHL